MVMLLEQYLSLFHGLRLEIAKQRQDITSVWLERHSLNNPVETIWTSKTQKEREKIMIKALVAYATSRRESSIGEDHNGVPKLQGRIYAGKTDRDLSAFQAFGS